MNKKENIILIGFMGSGKTTVGNQVAKELNYQFLDTDCLIEEQEQKKISEIFQLYGEEYFRQLETKLIEQLNDSTEHMVLSTGGGLPLREENAALLQELGCVIYLDVNKKSVIERLKGDQTRPLLQAEDVEERVESLLTTRAPKYKRAAHKIVKVDEVSVADVCTEVIKCYKNRMTD